MFVLIMEQDKKKKKKRATYEEYKLLTIVLCKVLAMVNNFSSWWWVVECRSLRFLFSIKASCCLPCTHCIVLWLRAVLRRRCRRWEAISLTSCNRNFVKWVHVNFSHKQYQQPCTCRLVKCIYSIHLVTILHPKYYSIACTKNEQFQPHLVNIFIQFGGVWLLLSSSSDSEICCLKLLPNLIETYAKPKVLNSRFTKFM